MKWYWESEKTIEKYLLERGDDEDNYVGAVRCGDLCFDFVDREVDRNKYRLFADLYVGGEDTGYGYGKNDYPYDHNGDCGCSWIYDMIAGMSIEQFKEFAEKELERAIVWYNNEHPDRCLLQKANEELKIW